MMDGLVVSIRETEGEGGGGGGRREEGGRRESEVWERRWLSCLFEDESERQCSEEVRIHKHTQADVCTRSHAPTHTHTCKHTHEHGYTPPTQLAHTLAHGEVVKGHG